MISLNSCANDIQHWDRVLKGNGVDLSTNAHLKLVAEAKEYAEDLSLEEAADVFIALLMSLAQRRYTGYDLARAATDKMVVNRQRKWAQQEDGTFQHVE